MSYFAAGFGVNANAIKEFETSFNDIVPSDINSDILRIQQPSCFLLNYGTNKVINDIFISDSQTGSWLILLGVPLKIFANENEKIIFLKHFFNDPEAVMKNEILGCFALLAFNGENKSFTAATDYNNTTPIFYAVTKDGIFFCSHELQLARYLQTEIEPLGFSMAIQLKLTWGSYTRFKNIKKLVPCQIITFHDNKRYTSESYWKPSDETQWPANFDDVITKWLKLIKDSIQPFYECANNKDLLCDFTAGEDSRLLLSQLHASGIPFRAHVDGLDNYTDVMVAREAAQKVNFDLIVRPKHWITEEQLQKHAIFISLMNDAYQDYFESCCAYATASAQPISHYTQLQYGGAPGGEAFRGSYYLRGKAIFPSSKINFDHHFFTKMKFLLDFHPGLLKYPDEECKKVLLSLVEGALKDVDKFPIGIKIDHLLRMFQTSNSGLIYKNPRYLPFATRDMTRSIYTVPPHFKRGGKLTKACTEMLYPELAFIKTQKGVPTVRKTIGRSLLFMPEYAAQVKSIMSGAFSRLLKWTDSNKPGYKWSENSPAITTLFTKPPYADWFVSSKSMITGHLYNRKILDDLLGDAKSGSSRYVPILGRIINQELACRWVYRKQ